MCCFGKTITERRRTNSLTGKPTTPISSAAGPTFKGMVPGSTINEADVLLKELGSGSNATVYLARELGAELAIKILHTMKRSKNTNGALAPIILRSLDCAYRNSGRSFSNDFMRARLST